MMRLIILNVAYSGELKFSEDENILKSSSISCVDKTFVKISLNGFIMMEGLLGDALFSEQQLERETIKNIDP